MLTKMISILVLTVCLESCNGDSIILPTIKNHERCVPLIIEVDANLYRGKCRCHEYQVSIDNIGRVSDSTDYDLSYCSKRITFTPTIWSDEYLYFFDELFFMKINDKKRARKNRYNRKAEEFFK